MKDIQSLRDASAKTPCFQGMWVNHGLIGLSSAYKSAPHDFLALVGTGLDAIEIALALSDTVRKVPQGPAFAIGTIRNAEVETPVNNLVVRGCEALRVSIRACSLILLDLVVRFVWTIV